MTKSEITAKLKQLEKYGFKVITFNHYKRMPAGATGFIDHIVTSTKGLSMYFLEVKIGRDRESEKQKEFRQIIEKFESRNKVIKHRIVTENNLADVMGEIYGG